MQGGRRGRSQWYVMLDCRVISFITPDRGGNPGLLQKNGLIKSDMRDSNAAARGRWILVKRKAVVQIGSAGMWYWYW